MELLINWEMGQCYYELGNYGSAKGYLLKAYMVEGKEIFEGEDDKYIKSCCFKLDDWN